MSTATPYRRHSFLWRSRNWISLIVLAPALVLTAFSAPAWSLGFWGAAACETAGWALFCVGATYRWWAMLYISGNKDLKIVSTGPYSMCRHPLYLGTLLLSLSFVSFLQSASLFVGLLATGLVYFAITLPREEGRLVANYGEAYEQYRRRVPALIPNISLYSSPATIPVNLSGLRAELVRASRWAALPLIAHLLQAARLESWWPHWMTLP